MASDLDTVRVLRALFNDMPRAPQGLSHEATMEWIQRSMTDFPGGELAYTIEHITRNSMLDIVLRLREDGYLKDDKAFDETVKQLETPEGRKTFGHSLIIDPWGEVVADGAEGENIVFGTLDLDLVEKSRRRIPSLHSERAFTLRDLAAPRVAAE